MRATGQKTPVENILNLGRKYQGERPFRHPKVDLVRKVGLKAAISFQGRRPYRGEALQFTQYRFIQDRTESLHGGLRKTNLTPAQHRFWRSATYAVLTAKTTEPNPRRQRCIEFLCQRSIESIGKRCIEPYIPRVRHWMSMEREQAHKKGGNKHKGLERLPDAQRRTRRSASLPRYTHGPAAHTRIAQERVATSRNRIG